MVKKVAMTLTEIENMLDYFISKHVPGSPSENILLPPPEGNRRG
jgi:hypothetical protein